MHNSDKLDSYLLSICNEKNQIYLFIHLYTNIKLSNFKKTNIFRLKAIYDLRNFGRKTFFDLRNFERKPFYISLLLGDITYLTKYVIYTSSTVRNKGFFHHIILSKFGV